MPNHTSNKLIVDGPTVDVQRFIESITQKNSKEETILDFEKMLPTPSELMQHDAPQRDEKLADEFNDKYGAKDWYDWRVKNWGTKWNGYDCSEWDVVLAGNVARAEIYFNTAWAPAVEFFTKISLDFPTLTFVNQYADEGGGFVGTSEIVNGQIDEFNYDWESIQGQELREELGYGDE